RTAAQADVDQPFAAVWRLDGDAHVVPVRSGRLRHRLPLNAREMSCHVDIEPTQQLDERAVQMEAVAAATRDDPLGGLERVDPRRATKDDVDVLVRHAREVRALERGEPRSVDLTGADLEAQSIEIGDSETIWKRHP